MFSRPVVLLTVTAVLFAVGCGRNPATPDIKTEVIDGVPHVFNTETPAMGRRSLEAVEILRIESFAVDPENPPVFSGAVKDGAGNLYLADGQNVRIYKFEAGGNRIGRFLRKGEGPGEFPGFGNIQVVRDHLWVIGTWPLRIAEFSLDGQFIGGWMFRTFRSFFLRTLVIDDDRFLTVLYRDREENQAPLRVSALIDAEENVLTQYTEDESAGIFRIRTGAQEGPAVASTNPIIAADIHHAYDRSGNTVYLCSNRDYTIFVKSLDGAPLRVIHKACRNVPLNDVMKEGMLKSLAPRISREALARAKEQLPGALNAVYGIAVLPNRNLAVTRITGIESVEIDVFDGDGRFIATVLPSAVIPDLRGVVIFGDTIGAITASGDATIYSEFRAANMKGILF